MDPELDAMASTSSMLASLDPETRARVILWLASKFAVSLPSTIASAKYPSTAIKPTNSTHEDFADLFFSVAPKSHGQKALLAAYWLSQSGAESFSGQTANALLKNLGFQIPNITDALAQNMRERPALVVQIRKSGNSQQARKEYKITESGRRTVESLISHNSTIEE